jgi:PAS domain S-box-containing protein
MTALNETASDPAGHNRFRRLRWAILTVGSLAILAFAASSGYDGWRAYRNALTNTGHEINNESKTLGEQTAWALQTVDLLLEDTARWYRTDGFSLAPERIDEVLANRAAGVRQIRILAIVDAQGVQRYRSIGAEARDFDVSDRAYFTALRDGTVTGMFMSEPIVTRTEHRVGIVLARRLEDHKGAFSGVVTAVADREDLQQIYRALDLGQGTVINLLRDSGTLLVRVPAAADSVGRGFPLLAGYAGSGMEPIASPIDGTPELIAVTRVRGTPLVVAVTRAQSTTLHAWREQVTRLAARTLLVSMLAVLAIVAMLRQLRRIEAGERALRESEERYALAMEGVNEGHWDWDAATDRIFLSAKMKTWVEQSSGDEIITRTQWFERLIVHPDDLPRVKKTVADHFDGRTPRYGCEYRIHQPDGQWRWLLSRGRCLRDAPGKPCRFIGSTIDITTQKQAQIDKEHLEVQLRQSQKMQAIGTLAGSIAHDFNNILGAILGYGALAHQQSAEGSASRRYLDNVLHAAGRAKSLVDRILGFSRSGMGERVPVNVQAVTEETLELLSASLPADVRLQHNLVAGKAAVIIITTPLWKRRRPWMRSSTRWIFPWRSTSKERSTTTPSSPRRPPCCRPSWNPCHSKPSGCALASTSSVGSAAAGRIPQSHRAGRGRMQSR